MIEIINPIYKNSDIVVLSANPFSWFPINGPVYIISLSEFTIKQREDFENKINQIVDNYRQKRLEKVLN